MKIIKIVLASALIFWLLTCSKNPSSNSSEPSPPNEAIITNPANGSEVSEIVDISVEISGFSADSVGFYIDGRIPSSGMDKIAPYECRWDVTGYQDSTIHLIYAKVYWEVYELCTDTTSVMINNKSARPSPSVLENPSDISASSYTLKWGKSTAPDFDSYKLFSSNQSGVSIQSTLLATIKDNDETSFEIEDQIENTHKYYKVYVFDTLGLYSGSNDIEVRTLNIPPDPIQFLTLSELGDNEVFLAWGKSDVHDFSKYEIRRSIVQDVKRQDLLVAEIASANDTTYIDRSVEGLRKYYYKVYAVDSGDSATGSNELFISVSDPRPSIANIISYSSPSETSLSLTWSACWDADFDQYQLFKSESFNVSDTSTLVISKTMAGDTTFMDNAVYPGNEYFYKLYVYDNNGFYRESQAFRTQVIDEDPQPVNVMSGGDPDENVLQIAWTKNQNIDFRCYKIYRAATSGMGVSGLLLDSILDKNDNTYVDSNLVADQYYYYTVSVVDNGNNYSISSEYQAKTLPLEPLPAALFRNFDCQDQAICLVWSKNKNTDFSHYRVCRSESPEVTRSSPTMAIIYDRADTLYSNYDVKPCVEYYYRIFAYDVDNNSSGSNTITGAFCNNALYFDGDDDWVTIPTNSSLELTNGFTIEMWFLVYSINSGDSDNKLITREYQNDCAFCIDFKPDYIRGYVNRGQDQTFYNSPVPISKWTHIAYSYQSGTGRIYIDGELKNQTSRGSIIPQSDSEIYIGSRPIMFSISSFHGIIDEFRIWNIARSPLQILGDMNHEISGSENGLVTYYRFNEGTGQIIKDLSNHGNDAYLGNSESQDANDPKWINSEAPIQP